MTCMLDLKRAIILLIKGLDVALNNCSPAERHTRAPAAVTADICMCSGEVRASRAQMHDRYALKRQVRCNKPASWEDVKKH